MATIKGDSEARAALARLLDNYSAELTTRDHKSLDAAADILRPQTRVFVAAMPRDTADDMIAAAIRLHKANMVAIPHIVARNIPDEATLDRMLARLSAEAGVDRAHVVGGDRDDPAGAFDSALQLLETGLFAKYGITRIAIACYPGRPSAHPRCGARAGACRQDPRRRRAGPQRLAGQPVRIRGRADHLPRPQHARAGNRRSLSRRHRRPGEPRHLAQIRDDVRRRRVAAGAARARRLRAQHADGRDPGGSAHRDRAGARSRARRSASRACTSSPSAR